MPKGRFQVLNQSAEITQININGIIGDWMDGNTSLDVLNAIEGISSGEIHVTIQSPGGSAFEGIAINNALKMHPAHVTTTVLGAAASSGSLIFMAGDKREMPRNTFLMIHEPALKPQEAMKARELRAAADYLDNLTRSLHATYAPEISIDDDQLTNMLMQDTWINAQDAVSMGFATELAGELDAVALSTDFTARFDNLPASLHCQSVNQVIEQIKTHKDFEKVLRDSGCSKKLATALVSKAKNLNQSESDHDLTVIYNHLTNFRL